MEHSTFFSLSLLIGFLICFTFSASAVLIRRRRERYGGPTEIFLPHILARWPWPRRVNPNYAIVNKEADSDAWIPSFRAFSAKAQNAFYRCDFNLLACLAYPTASKGHHDVRACCDLMHLFFMFGEYSDGSSPLEVRKQKGAVMDAFRNPHMQRPKGEWIGGEVAHQFWERTMQNATAVSQKRFIQSMDEYLESVVQQSTDRKDHHILNVNRYVDARRRTGGVKPSFAMLELGLDIPDEVMAHPAIQGTILAAVDLIVFSNDTYSYNMEKRRGDDFHNMITCVMNEYHTDVNGAMLWIEDFLAGAEQRFYIASGSLPQWEEPLDSQVQEYCNGLGQWVRANNDWSFEGERYFGDKGLEIKEKRWMSLLPKGVGLEIGPMHINSPLL